MSNRTGKRRFTTRVIKSFGRVHHVLIVLQVEVNEEEYCHHGSGSYRTYKRWVDADVADITEVEEVIPTVQMSPLRDDRTCRTCIHNGHQGVYPSGCTGCGVNGEYGNYKNETK